MSSSVQKEIEVPDLEHNNSLELQRYSVFSFQNVKDGFFDVTFLFEEKELHAHSFILWSASETFKAMLLGPLATKDPILITTYSYEDFKEFLTFFYLGKCTITIKNVMALVDLSESYNVQLLKDKCDQFLMDIEITVENLHTVYEGLKLYSLNTALENLLEFVSFHAEIILSSPTFLNASKDFVLDLVKLETLSTTEESLFVAVIKWAKHQFQKCETNSDVKKWMKKELVDILPYIRFPVMNIAFLHGFIVPNGYLFSSLKELSTILVDADQFGTLKFMPELSQYNDKIRKCKNKVSFTDYSKNTAFAFIPDKAIFECLKMAPTAYSWYRSSNTNSTNLECYWQTDIPKPKINMSLNDEVSKYFVVRSGEGKFGIKQFSNSNMNDCKDIIAKLYFEKGNFQISQGCQFRIV